MTRVFMVTLYAPVNSSEIGDLNKFFDSVRDVLNMVHGNKTVMYCVVI